jgi:beta-lactamase regulating signal transducer with metallopeptidase domain
MNPMLEPIAAASASAASAVVAAAWQGILLAFFVWFALRFIPALAAGVRSLIWTAVFLLIALLHFAPLAFTHAAPSAAPRLYASPYWALAIGALWLAASLARAAQLACGALHLRRLLRNTTPAEVPSSVRPLLRVRRRAVQLCASHDVARPCVLGFFRPRILVPPVLLTALSEEDLRQVVLHEMQHLHRRDDWANLLQKLALVVFPLNPALAWVERRLCAERELACDDRVLQSGAGRKAYALCLAHLAEFDLFRRGYALVLGAWERRPELVRRIQRIIAQPGRTMGRKPALAVTGSLVAGAMACTLSLARAPRLISFAPAFTPGSAEIFAQRGQALDPAALSHAVGGAPQMVRAVMPASNSAHARPAVRRTVLKRRKRAQPPTTQFADLRTPPPPQPERDSERDMVVMTAFSATETSGQSESIMIVRQFQAVQTRSDQPLPVVRTLYVVPTPAGWLVIKI